MVLRAANQSQSIASGNRTLIRDAVAQIGSSEPIWVTDEERRPAAVQFVKKAKISLFPFYFGAYWPEPIAVPHPTRLTPGHLPPGRRYLLR